ncbi:MAG: hypothetical protein ACYC64_02000 [Armatimonadota bacterium]
MNVTTEQTTIEKPPKLDPVSRRNFILLMIGMTVYHSAWMMQSVTRAPLVNWLGMSELVYGMLGSAWSLTMIGSFLFPWLSRRYPRKKWFQFVITMPYLAADLALGLAIVIAITTGSHQWLLPVTIGIMVFWPFAAGWTLGPQSEYIANCIPKTHIGRFVSMQQVCVGLLSVGMSAVITVIMSVMDVPARYAAACLVAYGIALIALVVPLFAHETPSPTPPPEPFWKPAVHAVRNDNIFKRMLGAGVVVWMAVLIPQNFIPMLAIREWGAPDWIATSAVTIQSGAMMAGAALAGLLGQRFTYARAVVLCAMVLPVIMSVGAWPVSSAFRSSSFEGAYEVRSGRVIVESSPRVNAESAGGFRVDELRENGKNLIVRFNRPVNKSSFSVYDVIIKDERGKRLEPLSVDAVGKDGHEWIVKLASGGRVDSKYRIWLQPYIYSKAGAMLDQDGNGRSPWDAYRVIIIAALWGLAFSGICVGLETMMYQLSPGERRSGYFSAFRVMQFAAPAIAYPLSGLIFKTGHYAGAFLALLAFSVFATVLTGYLLKPVARRLSLENKSAEAKL